jgi:6-phosphogluconolactonase
MALSGGETPRWMFRALADEDVPWDLVDILQVDERIAPDGDPDRNFTDMSESFLAQPSPARARVHPMPVGLNDIGAAAMCYAETMMTVAGSPPVLDLVHLGLGADGHTASLVPGDPVLDISNADVAVTGVYQGRRRMTLTYPVLNRARKILWFVTGAGKTEVLAQLRCGDSVIPACRVNRANAVIFADRAAAARATVL